jgi:hypothetical protein
LGQANSIGLLPCQKANKFKELTYLCINQDELGKNDVTWGQANITGMLLCQKSKQ